MKYIILIKLLVLTLSLVVTMPLKTIAASNTEIIDNDYQEISITVSSSSLHVVGANGLTLYIYNVTGMQVLSLKVDGLDRRFDINLPKGCYIVKVGKAVRKISIR